MYVPVRMCEKLCTYFHTNMYTLWHKENTRTLRSQRSTVPYHGQLQLPAIVHVMQLACRNLQTPCPPHIFWQHEIGSLVTWHQWLRFLSIARGCQWAPGKTNEHQTTNVMIPAHFEKEFEFSQLMPWSIWYCRQLYYSGIYLIRTSPGSEAERNNEKRTVNAICRLKIWRHEMKDICW